MLSGHSEAGLQAVARSYVELLRGDSPATLGRHLRRRRHVPVATALPLGSGRRDSRRSGRETGDFLGWQTGSPSGYWQAP